MILCWIYLPVLFIFWFISNRILLQKLGLQTKCVILWRTLQTSCATPAGVGLGQEQVAQVHHQDFVLSANATQNFLTEGTLFFKWVSISSRNQNGFLSFITLTLTPSIEFYDNNIRFFFSKSLFHGLDLEKYKVPLIYIVHTI